MIWSGLKSTTRGLKLPHDSSDNTERHPEREYDETPNESEGREIPDEIEKAAQDAAEDFDRQQEIEQSAIEAAKEFDEYDSLRKEIEDLAEAAAKEFDELQREKDEVAKETFEDDLENDLDEVRDELHNEYVNDMNHQLEGVSRKDCDAEEESDERASSEATESSESYEVTDTGMVYATEVRSETEGKAQSEIESENEAQEQTESSEPVDDAEGLPDDQFRNRVTKQESEYEPVETSPSGSLEDTETQRIQQPESNEMPETPEYETSIEENEHRDHSEVKEEESTGSTIEGDVDSVEEPEVEAEVEDTLEVEESSEDSNEIPEPEMDGSVSVTSEVESSETMEQEEPSHREEDTLEGELEADIPEEFIERVEELVEQLEELEAESEERVIVEALTGEPVVDRTLETRSFFGEDDEVAEEEEVRRRLRDLFGELSEEERERFKEIVRSRLKSEEDLEEFIQHHPSITLSSDFMQKLKDARAYVKGKRSGLVPKLIRELWVLEIQREWTNVVGEAVRKSIERSLDAARKVESVTPKHARKKKRKTGYHKKTEHLIKLHRPMTGKRPVGSFERYREWLEQNYPAVCERLDYPELLDSVRKFFELRKALRRRKTIKHHELEDLARELEIAPDTAIGWFLHGKSPHLFQIVDSALSMRDGMRLKAALLKKLDGIEGWSELERRLKQVYPGEAYKKIANYKDKKSRTKEFFVFLDYLERGGTKKGIAKLSGISQRRVRAFFDGELPWLLRHVLAKEGRLAPSKRYSRHLSSTHRVKFRSITVRGKEIGSYAEFKRLVDRDFPWLKERSDYARLLHVVRVYFLARRRFEGMKYAIRNEIVEFAEKHDVSYQTVTEWLVGRSLPMVIGMLEQALSVTEAKKELKVILKKLTGVVSLSEYHKRMKTLYQLEELKVLPNYKKDYELVKEFYRFLRALEKGGLYTDIIKRGNLSMGSTKRRRLDFGLPRLVRIAASIPSLPPKKDCKWLPLNVTKKQEPVDFIEAPTRISHQTDLEGFLRGLVSKQRELTKEESETNQLVNEFMYLLGLIASDGSFGKKDGFSSQAQLKLSKKYAWSIRVGTAFSQALERLGIKVTRGKDRETRTKKGTLVRLMTWQSQNKPLFHWMRRTLFGLKSGPKRRLRIDWILSLSIRERIAFIQGIADGDGHASVRGLIAGIATKYNKESLSRILASLGIESANNSNGLEIRKKKFLKIASDLPMFRHADSRLFRLREICAMIAAMKHAKVSDEERQKILEYHRRGFNPTQIVPLLWSEYGTARRSGTIEKAISDADL